MLAVVARLRGPAFASFHRRFDRRTLTGGPDFSEQKRRAKAEKKAKEKEEKELARKAGSKSIPFTRAITRRSRPSLGRSPTRCKSEENEDELDPNVRCKKARKNSQFTFFALAIFQNSHGGGRRSKRSERQSVSAQVSRDHVADRFHREIRSFGGGQSRE